MTMKSRSVPDCGGRDARATVHRRHRYRSQMTRSCFEDLLRVHSGVARERFPPHSTTLRAFNINHAFVPQKSGA
ncbi:hypothetical protein BGE01nite_04890 [Brevifollis gellanilyticus]|uniref:Uncharacterized protein n=1 Tax=Brevifollis gellanilyticus TaxID=748831 RepID=A0A512M3D3_9BACT|nr:hypothetical protein BGE01nite_04890 [Brevifollis gellanilyticus]